MRQGRRKGPQALGAWGAPPLPSPTCILSDIGVVLVFAFGFPATLASSAYYLSQGGCISSLPSSPPPGLPGPANPHTTAGAPQICP